MHFCPDPGHPLPPPRFPTPNRHRCRPKRKGGLPHPLPETPESACRSPITTPFLQGTGNLPPVCPRNNRAWPPFSHNLRPQSAVSRDKNCPACLTWPYSQRRFQPLGNAPVLPAPGHQRHPSCLPSPARPGDALAKQLPSEPAQLQRSVLRRCGLSSLRPIRLSRARRMPSRPRGSFTVCAAPPRAKRRSHNCSPTRR